MTDEFSIIGRRMSCQYEYHRQIAAILAVLGIGHWLNFRRFLFRGRNQMKKISGNIHADAIGWAMTLRQLPSAVSAPLIKGTVICEDSSSLNNVKFLGYRPYLSPEDVLGRLSYYKLVNGLSYFRLGKIMDCDSDQLADWLTGRKRPCERNRAAIEAFLKNKVG
jgi:hypothetical protein